MRAATTKAAQPAPTPDAEAKKRMELLGQAIRNARGAMSQADLGRKMEVPQTTVSRWEKGQVDLTMEQVRTLEVALDLRLGTLAMSCGYAEPDFSARDVEMALRAHPGLHPNYREDMVRAFRSMLDRSDEKWELERFQAGGAVSSTGRRKRTAATTKH